MSLKRKKKEKLIFYFYFLEILGVVNGFLTVIFNTNYTVILQEKKTFDLEGFIRKNCEIFKICRAGVELAGALGKTVSHGPPQL